MTHRHQYDQFFRHFSDPLCGLYHDVHHKKSFFLPHQFSLHELAPRQGNGVTIGLIDTQIGFCGDINKRDNTFHPHIKAIRLCEQHFQDNCTRCGQFSFNKRAFSSIQAHHATQLAGLIGASCTINGSLIPMGLAPQATIFSYKICDGRGQASIKQFKAALIDACKKKIPIVNCSLAVLPHAVDPETQAELEQIASEIPFVVGAAGSGNLVSLVKNTPWIIGGLAPAGRHEWKKASFSSGSKAQLWLPAADIATCFHDFDAYGTPCYYVASGVSFATAVMTGFLALFVAEFKEFFSYQELKVILNGARASVPGAPELMTIDMRYACFLAHCAKRFSEKQRKSFVQSLLSISQKIKSIEIEFKSLQEAILFTLNS